MKWMKAFPYPQPREIQKQALEVLERNWDKYDVFILQAPTAFGKTAVAKTLINAHHSVSVITPSNLLVDQFIAEFPDTETLTRLDSYHCDEWKRPCPVTRGKLRNFCKGGVCPAGKALAKAKYKRGPGVYNYHVYLAHKLYRNVLVVDEAHNLLNVIKDRMALRLWQHDYGYPTMAWTVDKIREWIEGLPKEALKDRKIELLKEAVTDRAPRYVMQRTVEEFNGKGTLKGEPEDRDVIKLLPVSIKEAPPLFWPKEVDKVILMSATIGEKDVEQLGLGGKRRVCYINCKSPIPRGSRPIIPLDTTSVNRNNMTEAVPVLAKEIQGIADYHHSEKGVIHVTYQLARALSSHLSGERYIFHNRGDKSEKYLEFRNAPIESGKILIACGMYEGIDLPYDLGRWQVIGKIPWMSLGSPAIKYQAETDPDLYVWETLKTTIQACGRICRTPEDYGVTYILDSSFWRMYNEGRHMIPEWFSDAVVTQGGVDG